MRSPSVETIQRIPCTDLATAKRIRKAIKACNPALNHNNPFSVEGTLRHINTLMRPGSFGVEHVREGYGSRSPEFDYINTGDSYGTTIVYINGNFRVDTWGDIVEKGNYE